MKDHVNNLEFWNISWDLLVWNRDRWVLVKEDTWKIESLNWIATKTWWTQDTSKIVSFDINKLTYAWDNSLIKESDILYWISWKKSVPIERNFVPSNFKIWYNITNNNSLFNVLYQNTIKIKVWWLSIQENIENTLLRFSSWYHIYGNLWFSDLYFEANVHELKSNTWKSLQIVSKIEKAYKNQLPEKYCSDNYSAINKDDLCWKYRYYWYNYKPKSDYYWLLYSLWSIYFRSRWDSMLPYQTWNYWCKFYISDKWNFSYTNKPEYINFSSEVWSFFCTWSNNTIKQYQDLKKIFLYR